MIIMIMIIIIIMNMLMHIKQNGFIHLKVLLVLTDRGILAQSNQRRPWADLSFAVRTLGSYPILKYTGTVTVHCCAPWEPYCTELLYSTGATEVACIIEESFKSSSTLSRIILCKYPIIQVSTCLKYISVHF
jgi:hypothetical protein